MTRPPGQHRPERVAARGLISQTWTPRPRSIHAAARHFEAVLSDHPELVVTPPHDESR